MGMINIKIYDILVKSRMFTFYQNWREIILL